jgi:hypothetical protein
MVSREKTFELNSINSTKVGRGDGGPKRNAGRVRADKKSFEMILDLGSALLAEQARCFSVGVGV